MLSFNFVIALKLFFYKSEIYSTYKDTVNIHIRQAHKPHLCNMGEIPGPRKGSWRQNKHAALQAETVVFLTAAEAG